MLALRAICRCMLSLHTTRSLVASIYQEMGQRIRFSAEAGRQWKKLQVGEVVLAGGPRLRTCAAVKKRGN